MPRFQGIIEDENPPRPGLCVKYFLSFPQKNLSPEKIETDPMLIFQLILFYWCFGKSYHSKIEK